jgi:hypothetical protein
MTDSWINISNTPSPIQNKKSKSTGLAILLIILFSFFSIMFLILALFFKENQRPQDLNEEVVSSETIVVQPQQSENNLVEAKSNEELYLKQVEEQIINFGFSENEALKLGYLVCDAFDEGQTVTDVESQINQALAQNPNGIIAAQESAIAAVTFLCPIHSGYATDLKNATSDSQSNMASGPACDPNYSGACVPIVTYDLDCPDIGQLVLVVGNDIHKFDRDRDGRACES